MAVRFTCWPDGRWFFPKQVHLWGLRFPLDAMAMCPLCLDMCVPHVCCLNLMPWLMVGFAWHVYVNIVFFPYPLVISHSYTLHSLTFFWATVAYFLFVNMIQCISLLLTVINSFSSLAFDLYINVFFCCNFKLNPMILVCFLWLFNST